MSPSQRTESLKARFAGIDARRPVPPPPEMPDRPAGVAAVLAPIAADGALGLLSEISGLLPALATKCGHLDATIAATRSQTKDDLAKVADVALQWQRIALGLKAQTETIAEATADFRRRAEAAEAEAAVLLDAAEASRRTSTRAAAYNVMFQKKVLSSFGAGSQGRAALDSLGSLKALPARDQATGGSQNSYSIAATKA